MLEEFDQHNQFKESFSRYQHHDPHLKKLKNVPLIYYSPLLNEKSFQKPGIFVITGGRQVGKTTFLKQFILKLLQQKKVLPETILFLTGELIDSHHKLRLLVDQFINIKFPHQYLFIDEINYIPDWDKSIKFLADTGLFEKMSVILTGSDSQILKSAMKRFPGRRGTAVTVDYTYHPLSFKEFVYLKKKTLHPTCDEIINTPLLNKIKIPEYLKIYDELTTLLYEYLIHGGYLPAITDFEQHKNISKSVINTYIQWISGDILKHNKSEHYAWEIFRGIKKAYQNGVSWNTLGKNLSIEHHKTVADYCYLLESMHVLNIQEALIEHKLIGGPKKNRKIYFRDPFIDHAVSTYLNPDINIINIRENLQNNQFASSYIEAVTVDHCKRFLPTYYIKGNKGEVDIAIIFKNKFYPFEVKWSTLIRIEEVKQIQQYKNGIILSANPEQRIIGNNHVIPLVRFLIHIDKIKELTIERMIKG